MPPNSGFGTYWSARNTREREGVSLGEEVLLDWDTVEPRTIDLWIDRLFHQAGMKLLPDVYRESLLYAIEMRRLDRWDWPILHLTSSAPTLDKHYRDIRAHAIYRIALVQAAHAPELLGEELGSADFKLTRVAILGRSGWSPGCCARAVPGSDTNQSRRA